MEEDKELKLLVLCGGRGTRVSRISDGKPKSLLNLGADTLIDIVLEHVVKQLPISEAHLLTGFRSEQIEHYYSRNQFKGIKLHFIKEQQPLGTGGAVLNAIGIMGPGNYLIINGDTIIESDLKAFLEYSKKSETDIIIAAFPVPDMSDYGGISVNKNCDLIGFNEKGTSGSGIVNAGIYFFKETESLNSYALSFLQGKHKSLSMEKEILNDETLRKKVWIDWHGRFLDVGTPERFQIAKKCF